MVSSKHCRNYRGDDISITDPAGTYPGIWQKRNLERKRKPWWSTPYPQETVIVFAKVFSSAVCTSTSHLYSQQVQSRAVTAKGACFWFRGQALWTSSSAACCSAYWLAQLEDSTAKGALEKKHKVCSHHPLETMGPVPAQVTFSLNVNAGHTANTIILSGPLAINLYFVSCPSWPSSIWTSVEITPSLS